MVNIPDFSNIKNVGPGKNLGDKFARLIKNTNEEVERQAGRIDALTRRNPDEKVAIKGKEAEVGRAQSPATAPKLIAAPRNTKGNHDHTR